MRLVPPAIIFINSDLVDQVRDHIAKQLHISQIFDGYAFDGYITTNPDFPAQIKKNNQRVMVIRPLDDVNNRDLADIVAFFKNGLISVEKNKVGPPKPTFLARDITWQKLGLFK